MGKGFGVSGKAQEGRERKAAQKELKKREEERKKEEAEAEQWNIGAKTKGVKQVHDEQKRQEKLVKKMERERLEAAEAAELGKYKPVKPLPKEKKALDTLQAPTNTPSTSIKTSPSIPSVTSVTSSPQLRPASTGPTDEVPEYSASNIDDALFLLDAGSSTSVNKAGVMERHPERRVKAAYAAFEEREMPLLKEEFPGLRLSQLKEKLQKRWQKSPENPMNQAHLPYNATKSQEVLRTTEKVEANLARLRINPE